MSTLAGKLTSPKATIILCIVGLALITLGAIIGPSLSPYGYDEVSAQQLASPSAQHWFGTDIHGRDVLTRLLIGARISLLVGLIGGIVSLFIGVSYGIISGYLGGKVDTVMMRIVDILYSLPRIIFVIALIAILDQASKNFLHSCGFTTLIQSSRILILFIALGFIQWLTMARIIRGQVLLLKQLPFVKASVIAGQTTWKIMTLHLLPNLTGIILVYLTLTIPSVILEESFLSFLGLGVQAPNASWGTQLAEAATFINPINTPWWLILAPASLMALTLLFLNFLGDSLRDLLDPRSQR